MEENIEDQEQLCMLRSFAARLLAKAATDIYSDTILVDIGLTHLGFYCDFIFKDSITPEELVFLSERMQRIFSENPNITLHEMVPFSASEYLLHHNQLIRSESVKKESGLCQVIQIDQFVDFCLEPILDKNPTGLSWKLIDSKEEYTTFFRKKKERVTRISALCFPSKDALKENLKHQKTLSKKNHVFLGEKLQLFSIVKQAKESFCFLKPNGVFLIHFFTSLARDIRKKYGFLEIKSPKRIFSKQEASLAHEKYATAVAKPNQRYFEIGPYFEPKLKDENLFDCSAYTSDLSIISFPKKELLNELLSALNLIKSVLACTPVENYFFELDAGFHLGKEEKIGIKAFTEFNLPFQKKIIKGNGSYLELSLQIKDISSKPWRVSSIRVEKVDQGYQLTQSLFTSIERFLALVIEHSKGNLPFNLLPEQARVISISKDCESKAYEVSQEINKAGFRSFVDVADSSLDKKIQSAIKENPYFLVLIGKKERDEDFITVRASAKSSSKKMSLSELLSKMELLKNDGIL